MQRTLALPRKRLSTLSVVAVALVAAGLMLTATPAKASIPGPPPGAVSLVGDHTSLVTASATTKALVANRIIPLPVGDARLGIATLSPLRLRYTFPIPAANGGWVLPDLSQGFIVHTGGLRFVNLRNAKSVVVRDFVIDLKAKQLTAWIPALNVRAPILNLDLSAAQVSSPSPGVVRVGNVVTYLTPTAVGALDAALGTGFFATASSGGPIKLGIATVRARIAG